VPDGLTLEQIKAQPHGVDMGPMVPRSHEMVCTPDGKIDLAPTTSSVTSRDSARRWPKPTMGSDW